MADDGGGGGELRGSAASAASVVPPLPPPSPPDERRKSRSVSFSSSVNGTGGGENEGATDNAAERVVGGGSSATAPDGDGRGGESTSAGDDPAPVASGGESSVPPLTDGGEGDGDGDAGEASPLDAVLPYLEPYIPSKRTLLLHGAVVAVAAAVPASRNHVLLPFLRQLWSLVLRVVGTAVGVAFGLGFSSYVYDLLEGMSAEHRRRARELQAAGVAAGGGGGIGPRTPQKGAGGVAVAPRRDREADRDENSYASLMASAGYDVPQGLLRGQILRGLPVRPGQPPRFSPDPSRPDEPPFRSSLYAFADGHKGPATMRRMWPNLPPSVNDELGKWIDLIVRDFIGCWYASVDECVKYEDETDKRKRGAKEHMEEEVRKLVREEELRQRGGGGSSSSGGASAAVSAASNPSSAGGGGKATAMVLTTSPARLAPFLEVLYQSLSSVLGTLATYASENVNVIELFLLKLVHVLSANVKVYRELRRVAAEKRKRKVLARKLRRGMMGGASARSAPTGLRRSRLGASLASERATPSARRSALERTSSGLSSSQSSLDWSRSLGATSEHGGALASPSGAPATRSASAGAAGGAAASAGAAEAPSRGGDAGKFAASVPASSRLNVEQQQQAQGASQRRTSSASHMDEEEEEDDEGEITEVAMIREYLLAGKLHRAITFGMDVPGLLFADPHGRDCSPPSMTPPGEGADGGADGVDESSHGEQQANAMMDDDAVLRRRLFSPSSKLLYESELDYNRVLAHRFCRVLLPRSEYSSHAVRSMAVEMTAGCVLTPMMGCFTPDYMNYGLVTMLTPYVDVGGTGAGSAASSSDEAAAAAAGTAAAGADDVQVMRSWDHDRPIATKIEKGGAADADGEGGGNLDGRVEDDDDDESINEEQIMAEVQAELEKEAGGGEDGGDDDEDELLGEDSVGESLHATEHGSDDEHGDAGVDENGAPDYEALLPHQAEQVTPLLTMSIIALQSYVDLDDVRLAREHGEPPLEIDWAEEGCRDAVRRLVLVIEAALLHGLRGHRRRRRGDLLSKDSEGEGAAEPDVEEEHFSEGEEAVGRGESEDERKEARAASAGQGVQPTTSAEDAAHLEASTLSVVLMEMTEDIDAFERRVAEEERGSAHGGDAGNDHESEDDDDDDDISISKPSASEICTLRTLIAAWLHTGQVYRTLSVFVQSKQTILDPFYHRSAFVRKSDHAAGFVRQLRLLDGVDILVDTMSVLSSQSIDLSTLELVDHDGEVENSEHDEAAPAADDIAGASAHGEEESAVEGGAAPAGSSAPSSRATPPAESPPVVVASLPEARPVEAQQLPEQQPQRSLVGGVRANFRNNRQRLSRLVGGGGAGASSAAAAAQQLQHHHHQQQRHILGGSSHNVSAAPSAARSGASAQPGAAEEARLVTAAPSAVTAPPPSSSAARNARSPVAPAASRGGRSRGQQVAAVTGGGNRSAVAMAAAAAQQQHHQSSVPPHLNFFRNSAFASSLRVERDRRMRSWAQVTRSGLVSASVNGGGGGKGGPGSSPSPSDGGGGGGNVDFICRTRGLTERDLSLHRECHRLARCFYSSTNTLAIRDTLAKKGPVAADPGPGGAEGEGKEAEQAKADGGSKDVAGSAITLETISARRRIEVPDDDSSFLLRAQPRPLQPIAVHRDQRNHDLSYKCFAATFEEPVVHPETKRYRGGRCIRKCYLKYFPSDRTASISPLGDGRCMDRRRDLQYSGSHGSLASAAAGGPTSFLPADFKKQRHLCNKWTPAGSSGTLAGSILTSSVMEPADFNSVPRTGKAIDFVYRMSLFERPVVELGGKKFSVQDSATMGPHRADASSLEMSDASLSTALLLYGARFGNVVQSCNEDSNEVDGNDAETTAAVAKESGASADTSGAKVELGEDGAPLIYMKLNTSSVAGEEPSGDQGGFEVRPFRPSFIRAALLVTSARQEAQLQCLVSCVRQGSARNATKAKTEALLQPCLRLLEFANSKKREKQSILLRDLKLGINHIDREQLRRNGILYPRYPTIIRRLTARIEYAMQAKPASNLDLLGTPAMVLYKIKCVAICEMIDNQDEDDTTYGHKSDEQDDSSGRSGIFYKEEWAVLRPFRDFTVFHKHLKNQVAASESSASAGARLVGAATAALTFGEGGQRQRKGLIPSLGQASKAGALGVTKRAIERRKEILNDYLAYLLSPNHLLCQCPELLRFLGAYVALPAELETRDGKPDSLGRIEFLREELNSDAVESVQHVLKPEAPPRVSRSQVPKRAAIAQQPGKVQGTPSVEAVANPVRSQIRSQEGQVLRSPNQPSRSNQQLQSQQHVKSAKKSKRSNTIQMAAWASIKTRIDQVKLSQVRNAVFQFLRYLFDLDNASFFRSRMMSALKTMSFAVTSAQEFHKTLFKMHLTYVNGKAMAGWIKYGRDIMWPDGIFFESGPDMTEEERKKQEEEARDVLFLALPDQLKTLLGQELAQDGLNVFHEMLQNRVVLKSMAYMIMDEVWLDFFPELSDVLTGTAALESED